MNYTINTPEGTRDRLFAECRDRRRVQSALTAQFRRRGYAEKLWSCAPTAPPPLRG